MSQPSDVPESRPAPVESAVPASPADTPLEQESSEPDSSSSDFGSDCQSWDRSTETHTQVPPLPNEIPSLDCPTVVGPYPIKGKIGSGGMGVVLRGYDAEFNRFLAIKLLQYRHKDNSDLGTRFLEEAQIMGQLQHPNIPPVHRLGTTSDGRPFFSMKLIKGKTLSQMLKKRPGSDHDLPRFVGIFENVCKALAYAHSRGILHRDLKPENIMVGAQGEMYVMDWGMAKVQRNGDATETENHSTIITTARSESQEQLTRAGMGTIGYMPPEQILAGVGQVDARSDVFGLGAILCVILTGKAPYQVTGKKELFDLAASGQLCVEGLERLAKCGADVELIDLARRCLAMKRDDRPAHAGEVAEAITHYQTKVQEERRQLELKLAREQVKKREKRKQQVLVLAALLLGIVALGVYILHEHGTFLLNQQLDQQQTKLDQQHAIRAELARDSFERCYEVLLDSHKRDLAQARAELKNAEKLLENLDAADLKATLVIVRRELDTVFDLEKVSSYTAAIGPQSVNESYSPDREYAKAYQQGGYWKDKDKPGDIAARIKSAKIHSILTSFLVNWYMVSDDPERMKVLEEVVRLTAPHLSEVLVQNINWSDKDDVRKALERGLSPEMLLLRGGRQVPKGLSAKPGLDEIRAQISTFKGWIFCGNLYFEAGLWGEAMDCYQQAARMTNSRHPLPLHNLGRVQFLQGEFNLAEKSFADAFLALPAGEDPLRESIGEHRRLCKHYLGLEDALKVYKPGQYKPGLPPATRYKELTDLADLCHRFQKKFEIAANLMDDAFSASPELANAPQSDARVFAARVAVLANVEISKKGTPLNDPEPLKLRKKALAWLRAVLAEWKELSELAPNRLSPKSNPALWGSEPDLASVREKQALQALDDAEEWAKLWSEAEAYLQSAKKPK